MLEEQKCMTEELIEEQKIMWEVQRQEADEEAWEEEVERRFEENCIDVVLEAEQWQEYVVQLEKENRRIEELDVDEKKMRQELDDQETLSFIREELGTLEQEEMLKDFEEEEDVWEERGEEFDRECEEWGQPGECEEWEEGMVRLAEELEEEEHKTVAKRKRKRGYRLTTRKRRKTTAMKTTSSEQEK